MLTIKLEGMDKAKAVLLGLEKQVRGATVVALNRAAFAAAEATRAEIGKVFDRPTPWVRGSVRYIKAVKQATMIAGLPVGSRNVLASEVDFDRWGNKQGVSVDQVLNAQIFAGQRRLKRHEVALQKAGILPAGMGIVPGDAARLDAYGNMQSGQIVQIMAWFQSFGEVGYKSNINDKGRARIGRDNKRTGARGFAYFALKAPRGKLLPGVYQRFQTAFGSSVKPVMIFVTLPRYKKRLDFYGLAKRVAEAEFRRQFNSALADEIRNTRAILR